MSTEAKVLAQKIAGILESSQNILMTIHESPDGDAVGSVLALHGVLKLIGKNVVMFSPDVIPMKLRFLSDWDAILIDEKKLHGKEFDVLLMLDCGDKARSGKYIHGTKSYKTLINIDHHISNDMFGDVNYVDAKASCTAEKVYEVIKELIKNSKLIIPPDVATALLTGIYDDTGGMRYISTTSHTLNIAADLVDSGANCAFVSENLFFSVSREKMELTSHVLSTLTFEAEGKIAHMVMTKKDLETTGAFAEDSEGMIDFPRSIYGVEVAFLIKEVAHDKYKLSFRSRGTVDVNKFCSNYGGGGHKVAAGCTISGKLDDIKKDVVNGLRKAL